MKVGDRFETTVEKLVFGGAGLCRTENGVVFVDLTAPGEKIRLEITEVKKDYARGRLVEVLQASSDRIAAPCPYFGECGGCDWQHLSMASQLRAKTEIVRELFARNFQFRNVQPIIASPKEFHYRNRIQLQKTSAGFCYRKKRSHDLLPIQKCLIAEDDINRQLENQVMVTSAAAQSEGRVQFSSHAPLMQREGSTENFEFSQVNSEQNKKMIDVIVDYAGQKEVDSFVDLYCGAGNLSFPLAEKFPLARGFGIDLDPALIRRADQEIQRRKWPPTRLKFSCGSVAAAIRRLEPPSKARLIVLDPPRTGIGTQVAQSLGGQIGTTKMIYVSCHPMTLVRDLKVMSATWRIDYVQPLDMFPQTSHIEVVVGLLTVEALTPNLNL